MSSPSEETLIEMSRDPDGRTALDRAREDITKKKWRKKRIAELEEENRQLSLDASLKRLILLLDDPAKGVVVVLDKRANEYTITNKPDFIRADFATGYTEYLPAGGEITIRWR